MSHPFDIPSDSDAAASEAGYDSDAHQLSKTSGRANKRRKLSFEVPTDFAALAQKSAKVEVSNADASARSPSSRFTSARKPGEGADFEDEADNESNEDAKSDDVAEDADDNLAASQEDDIAEHSQKQDSQEDDALDMDGSTEFLNQSLKRKRPSLDTLAKTTTATSNPEKKALKTGIIYLPRLPPFLKPTTLRTLLTPYTRHGINRLFLTPEPHAARLNRLKQGGNRKRMFTDGWVEFYSKRDAKLVAETLNGRTMGGKKGGRWRDDIWALRYLRGFKWADLVGERRDEEAERSGRLDAERRREKKERESFIRSVEQGKVEKTRREKEEARRKKAGPEDGATAAEGDEGRKRTFQFRQNAVVRKTAGVEGQAKNGEQGPGANGDVQRILSKIF